MISSVLNERLGLKISATTQNDLGLTLLDVVSKEKITRFLENGKALNANANLFFYGERLVSKYAIFGGQDSN